MNERHLLREKAHLIEGERADWDALLDRVGDARYVLIGEASHGTHEFYAERARITKRLLADLRFDAIAAEADWPDAWRVNRYVRGMGDDAEAVDALGDFRRFPAWMWRNADVLDFVGWLRAFNERHARSVGFHGLDLYSLHSSMEAVVAYLDRVDPEAARRARARYGCFDRRDDPQRYGWNLAATRSASCEDEVVAQLIEMIARREDLLAGDGPLAEDENFFAEQNARVAKNAEAYYRQMFLGEESTWNLRDTHMVDTLDALVAHLSDRLGRPARVVVWAHNSHVGDARAGEKALRAETTIGTLVRQRHHGQAFLMGFTTYAGTVTAASDWGEPAERKRVRPGRPDSWEGYFHPLGLSRFWLDTRDAEVLPLLRQTRLERAIGVVYLPESERYSHYFATRLGDRFDAIAHYETTRAVEPLERTAGWERGELPETYPSTL